MPAMPPSMTLLPIGGSRPATGHCDDNQANPFFVTYLPPTFTLAERMVV